MLKLEHAKPDIIELNDTELETVVGGNWLGDAFRAIGGAIKDAVEWVGGLIFGGLQGLGNLRGPFGPGSGPGRPPPF